MMNDQKKKIIIPPVGCYSCVNVTHEQIYSLPAIDVGAAFVFLVGYRASNMTTYL